MRMVKSNGNGELTQWLISDLVSECFSSTIYPSALLSIKRPSRSSKLDLALCNSQNWWATTELTHLYCPEELQGTSVFYARASRIWLVAWDVDDLALSTGCGQASSQGGRNVTNPGGFFDQAYIDPDYWINTVNQVLVQYYFYLNEAYYSDPIYNDFRYYCDTYHEDSSKIMEVNVPWDPGKATLPYPSKVSAWGQAEFQGRRDVRALIWPPSCWVVDMGSP
jgi:hypothetical protein